MTFDIRDSEKLAKDVCDLIKKASLFLNKEMSASSNDNNPSTNIDVEISDFLTKQLIGIIDLPVISEESESQYKLLKGKFVWIIDPLDGTLNALTKNIPFCISVSLLDLDIMEALFSCNYIPYNKQSYYAIKGKGAFLNNQKISVSNFPQKIVSYGLPGDTIENIDFHLNHIKAILTGGYISRQSGSAIHDILMTALGKYHGFYEFGLFLWDFIGADLVATECGCKSFYKKSNKHNLNDLRYDYIIASDEENLMILKDILNI